MSRLQRFTKFSQQVGSSCKSDSIEAGKDERTLSTPSKPVEDGGRCTHSLVGVSYEPLPLSSFLVAKFGRNISDCFSEKNDIGFYNRLRNLYLGVGCPRVLTPIGDGG